MTQSRISLNIHGQNVSDEGYLLGTLQKLNPVAVLVMDNLGLAKRIQADLPDCMVIYRQWASTAGKKAGDDDLALKVTPEQFVNERLSQFDGVPLWAYTANEPVFDAHTIEWNTQVLELAAKVGLRVVVGNWGVGKPVDVDNGWNMADKLLRLLDAYRDTAVLGLHEYACGVITSGFIGGTPEERGLIMPETWPQDTANIGALWHCGRFRFLERYCHAKGIKPPRIVITEHGFDDVSDIKQWTETLKKTPVEGNPGGNIRGWRTLSYQWYNWFPDWDDQEAYFEQLKYANEKIYKGSAVEAQLIFSWGHSSDIWQQFDIAEARQLHNLLVSYASLIDAPPPAAPPESPPVADVPAHPGLPTTLTNTSDGARVLRAAPALSGAYLRVIKPGVQFAAYMDTVEIADDMRWTWVTVDGVNGWTASITEWTNGQTAPPDDAPPVVLIPQNPGQPMSVVHRPQFDTSAAVDNRPDGVEIGTIKPGDSYRLYPSTRQYTGYANALTWYFVERGDVQGWAMSVGLEIDPDDLPPPQEPPPGESSTDRNILESLERIKLELEILKARVVALESRNEALETIVTGAGHILASVNGKEI